MLYVIVWVLAGAVAAAVTVRIGVQTTARGPLFRRNYRGIEIATAAGLAPVLGLTIALALPALLRAVRSEDAFLFQDLAAAATGTVVALAFALLGLWDDVSGPGEKRGWRAHLHSLRDRRMTPGALKVLAGGTFALVVAVTTPGDRTGLGWILLRAATIALAANAFNLLDVRPGRAGKCFVVAAVAFVVLVPELRAHFFVALCAVAAFLPLDLRERAMLGDTGANALGAVVGFGIIRVDSSMAVLISFALLVIVNVVGERPGLSWVIERVPPLRRMDAAGRART